MRVEGEELQQPKAGCRAREKHGGGPHSRAALCRVSEPERASGDSTNRSDLEHGVKTKTR